MNVPRNGVPQLPPAMSLEEFKQVPHFSCGEVRRIPVAWTEVRQHRFQARLRVDVVMQVELCARCGEQLTKDGQTLPPESPDRLDADTLGRLMRR